MTKQILFAFTLWASTYAFGADTLPPYQYACTPAATGSIFNSFVLKRTDPKDTSVNVLEAVYFSKQTMQLPAKFIGSGPRGTQYAVTFDDGLSKNPTLQVSGGRAAALIYTIPKSAKSKMKVDLEFYDCEFQQCEAGKCTKFDK